MGNKGKLAAASFIAGAVAALYTTKQMNKATSSLSAAENNSFQSLSKTKEQTQNYNPTTAESNNFFTKAPIINTDNNSKPQTYNNIYFEDIPNSEVIGNTLKSKGDNDTTFLNTALKIDSW